MRSIMIMKVNIIHCGSPANLCWASVGDGGLDLIQHWYSVLCLLVNTLHSRSLSETFPARNTAIRAR